MAESIGLVPQMIDDGRRITDAAMLDVVVMIYAGQINKILLPNYKLTIPMRGFFRR
jgi:acetylglutamate kinase